MLRLPTPLSSRSGRPPRRSLVLTLAVAWLAGCSGADGALGGTTGPPVVPPPPADSLLTVGERLFDQETFGGNGRTCVTCHMRETGTVTLEAVAARHLAAPDEALFRHDALDGGVAGTARIEANATIRVELQLPPYVTLVDDPTRRTIVVHRGIPSTVNTPALDGVPLAAFMYDLRNNNLQEQARDAVHGHAQGTVEPTPAQLDAIAAFQVANDRFFSSAALHAYARGGPRPELPAGVTDAERRGRLFFLETTVPGTKQGMCGMCHGGAGLNEVTALGNRETGQPVGAKFSNALVAETNTNNDPYYIFRVDNGAGDVRLIRLPDPGIMLTERRSSRHLAYFVAPDAHPALTAGMFKTPSLWGVRNTPPYFHDNSAKTLRDVVDHYGNVLFKRFPFAGVFNTLTEQEREDLVAYLKLL